MRRPSEVKDKLEELLAVSSVAAAVLAAVLVLRSCVA
jgi:hypothetical protein